LFLLQLLSKANMVLGDLGTKLTGVLRKVLILFVPSSCISLAILSVLLLYFTTT
jgi:hypothetical protein